MEGRRRRRPGVRRCAALAITAIAASTLPPVIGPAAPVAAEVGSASCTEAGVTWVVTYESAETGYGLVLTATDLTRIEDGVETDAGSETWELRWDHVPTVYPPAGVDPPSFGSVRGPLAPTGVERPMPDYLSPRFVTPDGICTVYLTPFTNLDGDDTAPKIAVLGDDLVHQLNDSDTNQTAFQGHVEARLTELNIRSEVEGHVGARLSPPAGTSGQAMADGYLADEYHGLLEHDIDGAVLALGMNDALYIAGGADQTERNARRDEVYASAVQVVSDLASRSGCVALVTAPQNPTSVDPDYAWAATQVNQFARYVVGIGTTTDSGELVDFGADAANHKSTDAEPWFAADGLHLAGAGLAAYTDALARAAQRCADNVVLWGAPDSLDDAGDTTGPDLIADRDRLPSGQAFNTRSVDAWDFGPSKTPWFSAVTDDGTLFFMVGGTGGNVFAANGEGMQVAAFNPDDRTFEMIDVKTDRDVVLPQAQCPTDGWPFTTLAPLGVASWDWCNTDPNQDHELFTLGGWIGDVETLNSGDAVAFTGYQAHLGQDVVTQGSFPALGIVSRGPDGTWQIVEGPDADADGLPDWRNAWSGSELAAATIAAAGTDPAAIAEATAMVDAVCPTETEDVNGVPVTDCGPWVNEIDVLPQSGDIVVTHYGSGKLSVIDVGDPDAAGRMTGRIAAVYDLPDIHDPAFPDDPERMLAPAPREVQADPSSVLGDERFALTSDFAPGLVEFSYDADAPVAADRLRPVSAPVLSGETLRAVEDDPDTPQDESVHRFLGYGQFMYDHAGNLWVPTTAGYKGVGVKVYVNGPSGRRITSPECLETGPDGQPLPLEDYVAATPGTTPTWGKVCRPDFNISQPRILGPTYGIEEDPSTHNVVLTDWAHGITTVVDPEGTGLGMTFRVGNFADPRVQQTSTEPVTGPCWIQPVDPEAPRRPVSPTDQPDTTCTESPMIGEMQGPIDASGRLWMPLMQTIPRALSVDSPELHMQPLDQWIYSVDVSRLIGRDPHQLTTRPGETTVVQAEQSQTMSTTARPGTVAHTDVTSNAPVRPCLQRLQPLGDGFWPISCTDPVTGIRGGTYSLGGDVDTDGNSSEPVPAGMTAEYRIVVPKTGTYDITYRATDRGLAGVQNLVLTVGGTTHTTEITNGPSQYGEMKDHTLTTPVTLTAGTHTVQIAAPQGGWELDWFALTRT